MEASAEKVKEIIAKTLSIEADKITENAALVDDLGADSLDMAELGMALQEEFHVELSDEQLAHIRTFKDVLQALVPTAKTA